MADYPPDACLAADWLGLRWSTWMPLMAAHPLALAQLPSEPGIYRIRRADLPHRLLWLGWEERGVRETVERLCRQVHLPVEPYDDPRSPALALWRLRSRRGAAFEVSGAALSQSDAESAVYRDALDVINRLTCITE